MAIQYLLFLAIVQGITEFLPISSSAHLILGRDLMIAIGAPPAQGTPEDQLAFDIALHVGSLFAVLLYFRRDAADLILGLLDIATGRGGSRARLLLLVVAGTLPILIVGFLARNLVTDLLRAAEVIAWMTIVFALALWAADRAKATKSATKDVTLRDALFIGVLQCMAIIPGVSRSGITMTAGRLFGLDRPLSARFALLLALPTVSAAGLLATYELYEQGNPHVTTDALIGGGLAFVSAWLAIAVLMSWLRRASYTPFVIYRVVLGLLLLALVYGAGWNQIEAS